jgi:uncharacterized repeat protein (TIGR01451 family)
VLTNTATVTSTTPDPNPGNESGTATTTVATAADLSVTKVDTPDPVTAGANLTYTITVNNAGPSDAASVSLSDGLPAGTTFVSLSSPGGWSCTTPAVGAGGAVSCSNATLAPGSAVFTLTVAVGPSVASGTVITNTATVTSTTADPNPGNESGTATTTVATAADLSVTKVDTPDPVTAGANLTYAITVNNAGLSDAATVSLSDALPAGTTFVSLSSPGGWSCTTPAVGVGGTVSCSVAILAPGSAVFTLTVAVNPNVAAGTVLTNTATVSSTTSDPNPGNESGTATTTVGATIGSCLTPVIVIPDGRVTTATPIPIGFTAWFGATLHIGHAYSLELRSAFGDVAPGTATIFSGDDACGGTSTVTTRDTTGIDPASPAGAVRLSFTAMGVNPLFHASVANGTGTEYTFSLSETTLFSPAWSTNGSFDTFYAFQNTTGAAIDGTLTLVDTTGATVLTFNLSVPAGQTASTNTSSLVVARGRTGTARFTHNGPPGAISGVAAIGNFNTNPAYVQPVKFEGVREAR